MRSNTVIQSKIQLNLIPKRSKSMRAFPLPLHVAHLISQFHAEYTINNGLYLDVIHKEIVDLASLKQRLLITRRLH